MRGFKTRRGRRSSCRHVDDVSALLSPGPTLLSTNERLSNYRRPSCLSPRVFPPRYATSSKTTPRSKETGELPADVETIQRHQQRQQPPINISRKPVVPKLWSGGHLGVVELWFKWPHAKPEVLYQLISAVRPICSPLTSTFHVRLHI